MILYSDNEPSLIRGRLWFSFLVLFVGYNIVNVFVQNPDMIIACRIIQASTSVVVLYVYFEDAWVGFKKAVPAREDYLIVGIWLAWLATFLQAMFSVMWRLAGGPDWLTNAEINAPFIILSVLGGMLHVSAPGALDGVVPRKNRVAMGMAFGVSLAIVTGLFATRPNIGPMIERARPYIGDFWGNSAERLAPHIGERFTFVG